MRKILLIILAVTMFFVTACGSSDDTISDKTSSSAVKPQEPEAPSSGTIENQSSTTSQSSVTSGVAVPGSTSASVSSTAASNQEFDNSSAEIPEISSTVTVSDHGPEQSADKEENALSIEITVNGRVFSATLYDNETARAFSEHLPLALDMSELNGNEKYYYLPDSLPTNSSRPSGVNTGDIMLYGSSCLVIFYESFSTSYSYTPIGKIDEPAGLAATLGNGSVQVFFNAAPHNRRYFSARSVH